MDRDRAIEYINQLLNSEYDLMQDRKLDTSNPSLYDDEATESEIDEIENAQEFITDYITSHVPISEEEI